MQLAQRLSAVESVHARHAPLKKREGARGKEKRAGGGKGSERAAGGRER
jgi:hypothetical protein